MKPRTIRHPQLVRLVLCLFLLSLRHQQRALCSDCVLVLYPTSKTCCLLSCASQVCCKRTHTSDGKEYGNTPPETLLCNKAAHFRCLHTTAADLPASKLSDTNTKLCRCQPHTTGASHAAVAAWLVHGAALRYCHKHFPGRDTTA